MSLNAETSRPAFSKTDLDLLEELARREARVDLWAYRRYLRPKMLLGWFQRHLASELMAFWEDYNAGKRPFMVISTPPQHGKSTQVTDFISWAFGQQPTLRTIFASYSDRLGVRTNLNLQRVFDSRLYQGLFPETRINSHYSPSGQDQQLLRNRNILEFAHPPDADRLAPEDHGFFRNTTVEGSVTGESLDLGIIDDPIKGAAEARSEVKRAAAWSWMVDDFLSRFSDLGALIMIMTRWHLDDPAGRLKEEYGDQVRILHYPALAEEGAILMSSDPRTPGSGEALFPEHKSREFLESRKAISTKQSWSSIYQQHPVVYGAGIFPPEAFHIVDHMPPKNEIVAAVRYWDKAGTTDGGAYTAGVLMHKLKDGRYLISDVVRKQLGALDREKRIKATAEVDGSAVTIGIEQEPGSGGKESAQSTARNLSGYRVVIDKVTGSKEIRAEPYAAQVQAENVLLLRGEWNRAFINEHAEAFAGKYVDQVDAASGAFALAAKRRRVSADDFVFAGGTTEVDF